MFTFVIASDGTALMPTSNSKKVRKLLRNGKAEIFKYRPFTIKLLYDSTNYNQPIEFAEDTGKKHIGISIKSKKHEFVHSEYRPLPDEKEKHKKCSRYRRTRRNHLRYRKIRFKNRKGREGKLAPSLEHIKDVHAAVFYIYKDICPITKVYVETGTFDTMKLKAIKNGEALPEGKDYQHGDQYGFNTIREAVFYRDGYKCLLCEAEGKYIRNKKLMNKQILQTHHVGYYMGDWSNRLDNLATLCIEHHTPTNHKPGGKLYGWKPELSNKIILRGDGPAFMNSCRKRIIDEIKKSGLEIIETNGSLTKTNRRELYLKKTHANDAYSMGDFHPYHRAKENIFQKKRRNSRVLERWQDAKYIDIRDNKVKEGSKLGCNRTNRKTPRNNHQNLRMYRGQKVRKGSRFIRKKRCPIRPGDKIIFNNKTYTVASMMNGVKVALKEIKKYPSIKKIKFLYHCGAWEQIEN